MSKEKSQNRKREPVAQADLNPSSPKAQKTDPQSPKSTVPM